MYHADFIGGVASYLIGYRNIYWGIRNSNIPQSKFSTTYLVIILNKVLSHFVPKKIICNSESGREAHIKLGFKESKLCVVHNGYKKKCLRNNDRLQQEMRSKYGIPTTAQVCGTIGRYDVLKGHKYLIASLSDVISKSDCELCVVFVGKGSRGLAVYLDSIKSKFGTKFSFILLEHVDDVDEVLSALDMFCLPSISEGFPNALAEAMLLGIPCVATNVGAVGAMLGDVSQVVAPADPLALGEALIELLKMNNKQKQQIGKRNRERILKMFDIATMKKNYYSIYSSDEKNETKY
ncbi:glycosyltransferase, partial [Planktomarina temperata]|nr:glycosyltransferase [Planktomarina temperata]